LNCAPIPPLVVKMIGMWTGTKSIPRCWHKSLYLLGFRLLCSPGPCIRVEKGVKGLATCTGTRVADCSSSWIHYAHTKGPATLFSQNLAQKGLEPPDLSVCACSCHLQKYPQRHFFKLGQSDQNSLTRSACSVASQWSRAGFCHF
jgi:hypothetical protein